MGVRTRLVRLRGGGVVNMVKRALRSLLQGEDSHQEEEKEIACLPKEQSIRVVVDGKFNWLTKDPVRLGYRYEKEFDAVQDVFELQRNLNNAFAYDLVPSPSVITAALRAARRVNDYPTAVRIFEGIKAKVENQGQYEEYLDDLKPLREELGVNLKEDLYPEPAS
ncbi:MAG: hypothetical protein L6R38_007135 [Xanthoria sp. 2 TBL-2021]|nr:MAG: hypothetical protein L6R38_007135 [Xanthoria sp. 2 TBL-2021]